MILTPQMMKDKKLYRYEPIVKNGKLVGFKSTRIDNLFNFESKQISKPFIQAVTRRRTHFF
jgi:hypothetical protein